MNLVRVGIIGAGKHIRRSHLPHLLTNPNAQVVAIYDLDPNIVLQVTGMVPGIRSYNDEESLLRDVDAVVVGSWDQFHAASLIAAVRAGKHVMVEKPIATTIHELGSVIQCLRVAEHFGFTVTSCHPRRFDRPYVHLKKNLAEYVKLLGKVLSLRLDFSYHATSKVGIHEGLLIDHLNHEVDLMHFLFGHVSFDAHKIFDSQNRYEVAGVREDGITFHFSGTRMLRVEDKFPEYINVRFERGNVTYDTGSGKGVVYAHGMAEQPFFCGTTDYEGRFRAVNDRFIQTCTSHPFMPYSTDLTPLDLWVNTASGIVLTHNQTFIYRPDQFDVMWKFAALEQH